jgi:hypothetical protein
MESAFDRKAFNSLDASTKRMVDAHYNFCLSACNEKTTTALAPCKQTCYAKILVPYKIVLHQAADAEENLYRQCLADKFPDIQHEDYISCTKSIYAQRVELLSTHFANTAESFLSSIH